MGKGDDPQLTGEGRVNCFSPESLYPKVGPLYNPGYIIPNRNVSNIDDGNCIQAAVVGRLYLLIMLPKLTSVNGYNHSDNYTLTSLHRLPTVLISLFPFHLARTSHFIENQSHKVQRKYPAH